MNTLLTLQQKADEYLIINPAALQILLQLQANALRLHQSVLRAANCCGCISLGAAKLPNPDESEADLAALKKRPTGDELSSLCPSCRAEISERMGSLLFYAAALANALGLDLNILAEAEIDKLDLLGYFMLM